MSRERWRRSRAPTGTHDVLVARVLALGGAAWPPSPALAQRAGLRAGSSPRCSRTPASSAAGSARTARSWARRCTSSPTGAARRWRCGPRERRRWCGPSSSTTRSLPWKAWYVTPAFRHERPQAGRYRQHHQVGVEALGAEDPDLDVEVVSLADDFYGRSGSPRSTCGSTRWATRSAGRPTWTMLRLSWPATGTSCATSTERDSTPTRCGCSTASGRRCREVTADAPRLVDHLCEDVPGPLRPGAGGPGRPRRGLPLDHRLVRGSTTTPGPPSSSPRTPSRRPRTASAAAAATTAWWRCWAARRPRASASASGSSGCCWPATPKVCFPVDPPPSTPSWSTWPGGRRRGS